MPDEQNSLFETEPQPWNLDDQDDWLAARIAFASQPYGPYDYSIPADLESQVKPGVRIEVPLGPVQSKNDRLLHRRHRAVSPARCVSETESDETHFASR